MKFELREEPGGGDEDMVTLENDPCEHHIIILGITEILDGKPGERQGTVIDKAECLALASALRLFVEHTPDEPDD